MTDKMPSIELSRPASTEGPLTRLAWLPIPLLLSAILACRLAGLREDYPYDNLRLALSIIFYTAVSLATLVLIARSFLKSGKPGLLLLECGVVLWSLSGTVGDALSHGDRNVDATIFNLAILMAGLCHLGGAALSMGPQRELRARRLWLVAGFGVALVALAAITWAAPAGWTPVFFIQGQGGTPVRTAVLIAAVTMFVLSAILLRVGRRGTVTQFIQWYCLALLLLAVGLFGIMIQISIGCIVNWLARSAQWLGGAYLLVAAISSVRETGRWEISLDPEAWDDRLLHLMTPYLLWTLPAAWRYGMAILVVFATTSLRWALIPWMGTTVPYNIALPAMIVTTLLLGIGPGLLSTLLSNVAVEVFILGSLPQLFNGVALLRISTSTSIGILVVCVFHAIRVAARKIQKNEARLSAFAEATFEGICESEGGLVVDCNEQIARMVGATRSELIGASVLDIVVPEDRERVLANIRENREVVIEHGLLRRNGTRISVEAHGRSVAPGSSRRYTAVRDITERKQAEEALRELNAMLESKVAERTAELAKAHEDMVARAAQLRALAGELTLAEQRERSRLAKVLHDHLQQLLVAAKFRTAVLGRGGDDIAKQAAREVEELIDESIGASRSLTAELSPPILYEAGLNAGLQWLARRMMDKQGIFVDLEMEEDGALPEDVKVLLFESVRELLFNVVKHAHTRSAAVNVRSINGRLQVIVSDEGAGFEPAKMPAAGEGGRGFGLFSIRERLELMGGTFEIASTPGQGSRFVLSMPVAPTVTGKVPSPPVQELLVLPEAQVISSRNPDPGRRIRVMLADDHAVVRQGIANLLRDQADIDVIGEAADGQEAVELANRLLPDIILMDLSMPKLNGVEATRIIHNDWPEIRIIGLSMFEAADRAQAMRDAGAVDYISKSGPAEALINIIRRNIRQSYKALSGKS